MRKPKINLFSIATMTVLLSGLSGLAVASNTHVKSIDIKATTPYPVFFVESNGESYTHVKNDGVKSFLARVSGKCKNTAHVQYAAYDLIASPKFVSNDQTLAHKVLDTSGKKHKTFGHNKSVNIQWKPNAKIKQRALQACQNHMDGMLKKKKSLVDIFGKQHKLVVDSGVYGNFGLRCDGLISTQTKRQSVMQPMEVRCMGSKVKEKGDHKIINTLKLNHVELKPVVANYVGTCPKNFKFKGAIHSNGAGGKIRYRFKSHLGKTTSWKKVSSAKGKLSFPVMHSITLENDNGKNNPGMAKSFKTQEGGVSVKQQLGIKKKPFLILEVQQAGSNKTYSSRANYNYKCTSLNPGLGDPKNNLKGGKVKKPDLFVLAHSFQLGNKKVKNASNPSIVIGADEASKKVAGQCVYRMKYQVKNKGNTEAQPDFSTQTSTQGKSLHIANTNKLGKGQSKTLSGNIQLKSGTNVLMIKTDHADKVQESNENNNQIRLTVTVKGSCDGKSRPPRPASETPKRPVDASGQPSRTYR